MQNVTTSQRETHMLEHLIPIILGQDTILLFLDAVESSGVSKYITGDVLRRKINEAEESVTSPNIQKQPYRNLNQPFRKCYVSYLILVTYDMLLKTNYNPV